MECIKAHAHLWTDEPMGWNLSLNLPFCRLRRFGFRTQISGLWGYQTEAAGKSGALNMLDELSIFYEV